MQHAAWTEDRVSTLRRLWAEGLSCSQIARQLTQTTRNAVIGKVHRMGLAGRRLAHVGPAKTRRALMRKRRVYERIYKPAPEPLPPTPIIPAPSLEVPFGDLKPGQCKAVTGNQRFAHTFCGHPIAAGSQYCAEHHRLHYQPNDRAKKKKEATARLASWLDGRDKFHAKNAGFVP